MITVKVKRRNRTFTLNFNNSIEAESYVHSVVGFRKIDYIIAKNQIIVTC